MKITPLLLTLLFTLLISLGANVEVPLGPVPFILSDFFVLLAALVLGMRWGGLSVLLYLVLGAIGLPVFAGGAGGYAHLIGNTGGYLFGFLLAVLVSGHISHAGKLNFVRDGVATFSGQACIFLLGVSWLKFSADISWEEALTGGFLPFLVPVGIKLIAVTGLAWGVRKLRK